MILKVNANYNEFGKVKKTVWTVWCQFASKLHKLVKSHIDIIYNISYRKIINICTLLSKATDVVPKQGKCNKINQDFRLLK